MPDYRRYRPLVGQWMETLKQHWAEANKLGQGWEAYYKGLTPEIQQQISAPTGNILESRLGWMPTQELAQRYKWKKPLHLDQPGYGRIGEKAVSVPVKAFQETPGAGVTVSKLLGMKTPSAFMDIDVPDYATLSRMGERQKQWVPLKQKIATAQQMVNIFGRKMGRQKAYRGKWKKAIGPALALVGSLIPAVLPALLGPSVAAAAAPAAAGFGLAPAVGGTLAGALSQMAPLLGGAVGGLGGMIQGGNPVLSLLGGMLPGLGGAIGPMGQMMGITGAAQQWGQGKLQYQKALSDYLNQMFPVNLQYG